MEARSQPQNADAEQDTRDATAWFEAHFNEAADQILEFLAGDGIELEGKAVADIGSGDGIIDLALAIKGRPESLVGYDITPTDATALLRSARVAGVADDLPANLTFIESQPEQIPAIPDAFDVVVTWSVFEHVGNPIAMLGEVRRTLRPDGVLFMQIWPLYYSEHGGHLWPHYDEPFPHLRNDDASILETLAGKAGTYPGGVARDEYRSLNRTTLDDLQRALLSSGLVVTKLELMTKTVHIPIELAHLPLSAVGIGGVKLLAVPR